MTFQQKEHTATEAWRSAPLLLLRTASFALLWWLLTEGRQDSWALGVPVVLLAAWLSHNLAPPSRRTLSGLVRFIPYFIVHSLRGAVDVAWRALHPAMPITPVLIDYRLHLPSTEARVFMTNTTSLLPGTLSAMLDGERLQVHVLDGCGDYLAELEALERRVAALFPDAPEG